MTLDDILKQMGSRRQELFYGICGSAVSTPFHIGWPCEFKHKSELYAAYSKFTLIEAFALNDVLRILIKEHYPDSGNPEEVLTWLDEYEQNCRDLASLIYGGTAGGYRE